MTLATAKWLAESLTKNLLRNAEQLKAAKAEGLAEIKQRERRKAIAEGLGAADAHAGMRPEEMSEAEP